MSSTEIDIWRGSLNNELDRFASIIPANTITPAQLTQSLVFSAEQTPKLLQCTADSRLRAAVTSANFGLPCDGVSGQAYMIPRKDHGVLKAQYQTGYKGYISLGARGLWILDGDLVREHDDIEIQGGDSPRLLHSYSPKLKDRGRVIGVYGRAQSNHYPTIWRYLSLQEVYQLRDKSQSYTRKPATSPWTTFPSEMILKTAYIAVGKRLPLPLLNMAAIVDEQSEYLNRQVSVNEDGRLDIEGTIITEEPESVIDQLGETSAPPPRQPPREALDLAKGLEEKARERSNGDA